MYVPANHFFDDLAPAVQEAVEAALARIAAEGAEIDAVDVPEAGERGAFVDILCGTEFIANFGRERFEQEADRLDPLTIARAKVALPIPATEYVRMQRRQHMIQRRYAERLGGFDAWLTPTVHVTAPEVAPALRSVEATVATEATLGVNTHLISYFDLCATTTPLPVEDGLPVGLQTICGPGRDAQVLAIAMQLERLFGRPARPDLAGFLG